MIKSKEDYLYFLKKDKIALSKNYKRPRYKHDVIWSYQILLRKCEYLENCKKGFVWKLITKIYKLRFVKLSQKLGFSIPLNVFGPGLSIAHYGCIVVNHNARIGSNCRIHEGVTIGASGNSKAPKLGNNIFIATGAKILGDIEIADNVVIGANAVVVKDILQSGITVGGVPAKQISMNDSSKFIVNGMGK